MNTDSPKERARYLFDKHTKFLYSSPRMRFRLAKKKAINEIDNEIDETNGSIDYLQEVKIEIEKLNQETIILEWINLKK